jgi:hypothetical protein
LHQHYHANPRKNLGEGSLGLDVVFRSDPLPTTLAPMPVDFSFAPSTAVVVLLDAKLAEDEDMMRFVHETSANALHLFPAATVVPVIMDQEGMLAAREKPLSQFQFVDTIAWSKPEFLRRALTGLDYQFCKLLSVVDFVRENPRAAAHARIDAHARKAKVFLSHSKHDTHGARIAVDLKAALNAMSVESFFDVVDIIGGTPWECEIDHAASTHALLAVHTDSYSSRSWCRKEVLMAKRKLVPMVVANCIEDAEDRTFPYLGNVPAVRVGTEGNERFPWLIGRLFDEVLRDLVWRCHTKPFEAEGISFLPRAPELVSLAYLDQEASATPGKLTLVYPGALLEAEEAALFATVAPHITLQSFIQWLSGAKP